MARSGHSRTLLPLPTKAHLMRWVEAHVTNFEIEDLLDAGSGVKHQSEQHVVTLARRRGSIDCSQEAPRLRGSPRYSTGTRCAPRLNGMPSTPWKVAMCSGYNCDQESREGMQPRQACVAGSDAIVSFGFEMPKESSDALGREVAKLKWGFSMRRRLSLAI